MKNKNNYLHIKSMSQLKSERARLDSNITMKETLFNFQYLNFKESLSIGSLISSFISNIATIIPIITRATNLCRDLCSSIISQFRGEKKEQNCSQEIGTQREMEAQETEES